MFENRTSADVQHIVDALEQKRVQCAQQAAALEEQRRTIALAVHAGNDERAASRLKEIHHKIAEHGSLLASLDAAVSAGRQCLLEAQQRESAAADRAKAEELRDEVDRFAEAGRKIDAALITLVDAGKELRDSLARMHALGAKSPSHEQVDVLGFEAVLTALNGTIWGRRFQNLPPRARRSFAPLVTGWRNQLMATIARRLAA